MLVGCNPMMFPISKIKRDGLSIQSFSLDRMKVPLLNTDFVTGSRKRHSWAGLS